MNFTELKNKIFEQIKKKIAELFATQGFEKSFDFTRTFVAKKNTADTFSIPLPTEGPFYETGYNISFTKNSKLKRDGNVKERCEVKIRIRSQNDNAAQSNDYIPISLIATPGAEDSSRYGSRPFTHIYPAGDVIYIDYDNREPAALVAGDEYEMEDEEISICFNGKLYPGINLK